jgi:hypothetical protein
MKRKKSPGSRSNQRTLRREKSAPGPIARLLPELLEIHNQATEQAAGMIEIEVSLAPGAWSRSSLELVLNTLIECRSLLAAAAPLEEAGAPAAPDALTPSADRSPSRSAGRG